MKEDPVIVVDLETSGLDPQACGILEIGAVHLECPNGEPPREGRAFHRHVAWNRSRSWESGAERVHGLTMEEATSGKRHADVVALHEMLEWIDDIGHGRRATLAGMNPQFDLGFLRAVANRSAMWGDSALFQRFHALVSHRTIDLHTLAVVEARRRGLGIAGLKTDGIYEMLGMEAEPKPHSALTGARMEAEAILRLLTGRVRYA